MWRTVKFNKDGNPLWDVNEQGVVYSYRTKSLIGKKNREINPYYCVSDNGSTVFVHNIVAKAFPEICGEWFDGCVVHHKDCNGLNNAATNLIVCSKEQHLEYHRQLGRKKKVRIEDKNLYILNQLKELKKDGSLLIHYYCRYSKTNKKGLSPIEISIRIKGGDKKRYFYYTEFKANPNSFEKGRYSKEFKEFVKQVNSIVL